MPPFDNKKVRQAVNMAINKDRIVRIINNRACRRTSRCRRRCRATTQDYKGYRLRSGKEPRSCWPRPASANGFETELYAMNTDPNPRIAQAIQQDLAAVGIKAELKPLAQADVIAAGGDEHARR